MDFLLLVRFSFGESGGVLAPFTAAHPQCAPYGLQTLNS